MKITYEAKRSIGAGHVAGSVYTFDLPIENLMPSVKIDKTRHVPISRKQSETWLRSISNLYSIKTSWLDIDEQDRINYALSTEDIAGSNWIRSSLLNAVNNSMIDPDGNNTGVFISENATTVGSHHFYTSETLALDANEIVTYSILGKIGTRTCIRLLVNDHSGGTNYFQAAFDLTAGGSIAVVNAGTGVLLNYGSEIYPDGWYRIYITGYFTSSVVARPWAYILQTISGSASYAGIIGNGLYVCWPQFEFGDKPTEYIKSEATPGIGLAKYKQAKEFLDSVSDGTQFQIDFDGLYTGSVINAEMPDAYSVELNQDTSKYIKYNFEVEEM